MKLTINRALPYIFVIAGIIGVTASFALTYDKIQVLKNPTYTPSCNINPILSCGSVMKTEQANVLGIPNTIFGLMAFSMLIAFGLALFAGATFKRWLWLAINLGALGGFFFFIYLYFESLFRIHAICPYCFVVWLIVPVILWYTTIYNLTAGYLKVGFRDWVLKHHGDLLLFWYLVFFALIIYKFWYYWETLI